MCGVPYPDNLRYRRVGQDTVSPPDLSGATPLTLESSLHSHQQHLRAPHLPVAAELLAPPTFPKS